MALLTRAARSARPTLSVASPRRHTAIATRILEGGLSACAHSHQSRAYAIYRQAAKKKAPQCPTCGAAFQTEKPGAPGYLNSEKWKELNEANLAKGIAAVSTEADKPKPVQHTKKMIENLDDPELKAEKKRWKSEQGHDRIVCQRCHSLKNYNKIDHHWKQDIVSDPRALRFLQYRSNLIVVVVCDLFDIPGSLIPHLGQYIGQRHPVLLAWLRRFTKDLDINLLGIHLVSAQKNQGVRELAADITERRRAGQDIYMVGPLVGSKHRVLSSHIPGTTMGLYGVPLKHFVKALVPIEGARPQDRQSYLSKSAISYLTNEELKLAMCQKRVSPFTFLLNRNQSMMLGGLGRIDLVGGAERIYVTVFSSIRPHFTRMNNGEQTHEFEGTHPRNASIDIAFAGIGWVAIAGRFQSAKIRVYTPFGTGAYARPPMMPFEFKKLTGRMSSTRKTPK
ncbi:hypothetical protein DL89DRAFT_268029 [Linderina pennispora]|uniref:Uncharacterized protein n=1 Tax=Linderina pennispora TaxID=61395 RepID=A0A1Y1W640_9FUNG|nr:uncharacterized protein DL89DRAFT_268029 [Linderina pennispora]ORX68989.1 hypothetical protein DL89DRAFT_268029 [Linderina pennispora]